MKYLSVCSGIEAASIAWEPLGWEPLAFSEIEPFPRAVLQHHYPQVPLYGDFTRLRDEKWIADADLLVGGCPCQAFSVAGLRNSLSDDRGNLTLEYVRLANAVDDLRRDAGRAPAWILYENVPGILSVSDNAFGAFLGGLVGSDEPLVPRGRWEDAGVVAGPERVAAWRILDAQHFGLAQRRRRVFVLARRHPRGWACADALLPLIDSLSGHPAPRREAGKGTAAPTAPSLTASGRGVSRTGESRGQDPAVDVAPTLRAGGNSTGGDRPPGTDVDTADSPIVTGDYIPEISPSLKARGPSSDGDGDGAPLIAHTLKGEGFDASEDGTGRGTPLVAVSAYRTAGDGAAYDEGDLCAPQTDPSANIIAFSSKDYGQDVGDDISPTLRGGGHDASHENGGVPPAVAYAIQAGPCHPLAAHAHPPAIAGSAVRRLTPTECERLQGFPDSYTLIPWRGRPAEECPDGPRYKALGNSMATNVMRYIGERIAAVAAEEAQ